MVRSCPVTLESPHGFLLPSTVRAFLQACPAPGRRNPDIPSPSCLQRTGYHVLPLALTTAGASQPRNLAYMPRLGFDDKLIEVLAGVSGSGSGFLRF